MRHAVILYVAREGSSAITSHLRRHPRIAVPVFEQLDHYLVEQEVPPERRRFLPAALRRVFRSGRYAPDLFAEGSGEELPAATGAEERRVVFKWRGWGLDAAVAEVFAAERVGVFLLNRRDLLNLGLSLYYTKEVIGGGRLVHPQFTVVEMPEAERPAYLAALRARRFRVEPGGLAAEMRAHIGAKRGLFGAMAGFAARGIPVRPLWYEEYQAAPEPFLTALLARLGLKLWPQVLRTEYVKVSREDMREQVENPAELEADPEIRRLLEEWGRFCAEVEALAGTVSRPETRTGLRPGP
jgi:hypothetical protein